MVRLTVSVIKRILRPKTTGTFLIKKKELIESKIRCKKPPLSEDKFWKASHYRLYSIIIWICRTRYNELTRLILVSTVIKLKL